MNNQLITHPPSLLVGGRWWMRNYKKTNVIMKVTLSKWTKTRTVNVENGDVSKKINRYQLEYFINVFEMIRHNLESNVTRALVLKDTWVFDTSNELELFKNKLSVEFMDWQKLVPIVWKVNIIDVETSEDTSLTLEINSIDIFVIDRSLISNVGNRKNTRKQKIKAILEEDFDIPVNLITQDNTSIVTVKVFNKTISTNNFYRIDFDLTKSNPFPFYQDKVKTLDFNFKKLNAEIKNKISEMSIDDEKFFYALRVNIIFSKPEKCVELNSDDGTFFKLLENSASDLFN